MLIRISANSLSLLVPLVVPPHWHTQLSSSTHSRNAYMLPSNRRLRNVTLLFVQSPYVEAPRFGSAYSPFNFPMPTAPPGAQRDPVPWPAPGPPTFLFMGHLFCTILLLVLVDDRMAFICGSSIVERRSIWVLSICFLRMYNRSIKMIHTSTGSPCCVQACRAASDVLSRQRPVGIVVYINYITSHIFFSLWLWVHNCFNLWPICAKQSWIISCYLKCSLSRCQIIYLNYLWFSVCGKYS